MPNLSIPNRLSPLRLTFAIVIILSCYIRWTLQLDLNLCKNSAQFHTIKPSFRIGANRPTGQHSDPISTVWLDRLQNCPNEMTVKFSAFERDFELGLVRNERLIGDRYHENAKNSLLKFTQDTEFSKNNFFLNLGDNISNYDHCHYHGKTDSVDAGPTTEVSAISVVNKELLSGLFHHNRQSFYLYSDISNSSTILSKSPNFCTQNYYEQASSLTNGKRYERSIKPDNVISHAPFLSNSSSLFVELLIVHDHGQYNKYKGNTTMIMDRTLQIVNIMNSFYRQLNIYVALVGIVLWVEKDEISLTEDGDATLKEFLKYRYEKLLSNYHHDNAQLITDTKLKDGVVGKALRGPICTHEHSGGVNKDHDYSPAVVAVTLAHELGHNFGMEHDEDDSEECKCPDERCIMSSRSSEAHPKHWSSCSINYLEDAKKHGLLDCLKNEPTTVIGPLCGNGFVEEGEDCDIGESIPISGTSRSRKGSAQRCRRGQNCDSAPMFNPCCDRQTCKFVVNATCAQGQCCDLSTCSVYNGSEPKICRERQGECDLEEFCDGKSEYCPDDVYHHDGLECGQTSAYDISNREHDRYKAYCFEGRCRSHDSQCKLLWGPTGSTSRDSCFEQNVNGNTSGHCGYNPSTKTFRKCEHDDTICGMLHCIHEQEGLSDHKKHGKLDHGFESSSILTMSYFNSGSQTEFQCYGAIIDAGPNNIDPGLVPSGASCGEDKMCFNQRCVPVQEILYKNWCPSDCNGNGICDNRGVCHCSDGNIGTSCYQFFGANFHISLLLYTILFFVPIIALVVFTINHYKDQVKLWWFLHNKKTELRARHLQTNQSRRMTYNVDRSKVSISEPIPLNHPINSGSARTYDPFVDPWLDSDPTGPTADSSTFGKM